MNNNLVLFTIFGGVYLLLYGMRIASEGMQSAAGSKLRQILGVLTQNRFLAVLVGAVTTATLQSSSATTALLVGLTGAGLMELKQAMGVILGADIGTTLTVQLLAFGILNYAPLLIGIGAALMFSVHQKFYRYVGQAILGFGLVFLAMKIMTDAMQPLRSSTLMAQLLLDLGSMPLLVVLIAAAFTALIHSSAATIGLTLTFATQGLVTLELALPIILGANIGTCATALLSSLAGNAAAKRVAVAHTLFKVIGASIFYPFAVWGGSWVAATAPDVPRQIANAHTIFNVAIAVLFLPFLNGTASLLERAFPDTKRGDDPFRPKYLDQNVLDTPALALSQATRETLRMGDVVQEMFRDTLTVFRNDDEELAERLQERDDVLDRLEEAIKLYLTQLSEQRLTPEQSKREVSLLFLIQDIENIGDIIDKNLMELAKKKIAGQHTFSSEGAKDIEYLHGLVAENLELALSAFATQDVELAQTVLRHKISINRFERELRQAHIKRLHEGVRESLDTSAIHLDVLSNLKRINSHATNIAYVVLGDV